MRKNILHPQYLYGVLRVMGSMLPIANAVAETATGFVYVDKNGNGKKDKQEMGLPGVAVSNGVSYASIRPPMIFSPFNHFRNDRYKRFGIFSDLVMNKHSSLRSNRS